MKRKVDWIMHQGKKAARAKKRDRDQKKAKS